MERASDEGASIVYRSAERFEEARIHGAAIYCSDGRFGEAFDDFLRGGLELPRYDRLAIPGGPACLAGHLESRQEQQALLEQLRFLVDAHGLDRVVLVAHEGCAYYTQRLRISRLRLREMQREDIAKAAELIRTIRGDLIIEAYCARVIDGQFAFEAW